MESGGGHCSGFIAGGSCSFCFVGSFFLLPFSMTYGYLRITDTKRRQISVSKLKVDSEMGHRAEPNRTERNLRAGGSRIFVLRTCRGERRTRQSSPAVRTI